MKKILFAMAVALFSFSMSFAQQKSSANHEDFIKKELAKYVSNERKNPNVILSAKAKSELEESSWPEIQCGQTGDLDCVGPNVVVKKIGKNMYRYQCTCTCGKETYVDNWSITAVYYKGKVLIKDFGIINQ